tara:strand:- start:808 stop:1245 length:438 start_codon:yes stop_codon:yes gene_type:complete
MSFADELKVEKAKMLAQKEEEKKRTKKSSGGGKKVVTRSRNSVWKFEDEVIAMYLELSGGSKFLTENYSRKRQVSLRAMQTRMAIFGDLHKSKKVKDLDEQTQSVYDKYKDFELPELQKVVISILRGENQPMTATDDSAVIRKPE